MKHKNVVLKCENHPKYTGSHNPRNDCVICWKIRATYLLTVIEKLKKDL